MLFCPELTKISPASRITSLVCLLYFFLKLELVFVRHVDVSVIFDNEDEIVFELALIYFRGLKLLS